MLKFDVLAGSWPVLTDRLDRTAVLPRWALTEPALAGIGGCAELPDLIRNRTGGRGDEVFAALVRTAARDGGDDPDAVLLTCICSAPASTGSPTGSRAAARTSWLW